MRGLAVIAPSLIKRSVCSSQVEISDTFMNMSLNLIYFTDFYFIEILTSLFSFFSTLIFSRNCYLKLSLFRLQHYHEFSRFSLCGKLYRFRDINFLDLTNFQIQTHDKKILNENMTFPF